MSRKTKRKTSLEKTLLCPNCESNCLKYLFSKESRDHIFFTIYKCLNCSIVHVNPQPSFHQLTKYYTMQYFQKRTMRGYNNYFSKETRKIIRDTLQKNLQDLKFEKFERTRKEGKRLPKSLDIGCASGYFLELLNERGWQAQGVEISQAAAKKGLQKKLVIRIGDYLEQNYRPASFDLITLWASIEHLPNPKEVLQRIHKDLKPRGRLIISTCRHGWIARFFGSDWRYMNVPEHLFFFSQRNLTALAEEIGIQCLHRFSYGSGLNTHANAGWHFFCKKSLDFLAKKTNQGDMMVLYFEKK